MLAFNTFLFGILLVTVSFALACFIAPWFETHSFSDEERQASYELGNRLLNICFGGFAFGLMLMFVSH